MYINSVIDLHEFHVWFLNQYKSCMSVHLVTKGTQDDEVYKKAIQICKQFEFDFFAVQLESVERSCTLLVN